MASPEVAKMFVNIQGDLAELRRDFAQAKQESGMKGKEIGDAFRNQFGKFVGTVSKIKEIAGAAKEVIDGITRISQAIDKAETNAEQLNAVIQNLPFGVGEAVQSFQDMALEADNILKTVDDIAAKSPLLAKLFNFKDAESLLKELSPILAAGSAVGKLFGGVDSEDTQSKREIDAGLKIGELEAKRTERRTKDTLTLARTLERKLALSGVDAESRQALQNKFAREDFKRVIKGRGLRGEQSKRLLDLFDKVQGAGAGSRDPSARQISISRTAFGGAGEQGIMTKPITEQQGERIIGLLETGNIFGGARG